ncbi:MAG: thymidine phosphorylase [Polyangiaceae bacterium]
MTSEERALLPVELIAKKRAGGEHSRSEIQQIISRYLDGSFAEYQMSAWLMAVFFNGMTDIETVALTEAMLHSGDVLDLSSISGLKVDKHSTGGVGDKVSLCLAPLVAACGVPVPMVSGRGLGHTGGTLDKLEAIPGFSVHMEPERFAAVVRDVGAAMIGQTSRIAPADKRIYALRDVTATVESIPLIVASILSKKLAEGIDGLVLDVKVGRGAFMKTMADAERLAGALVRVGTAAGKRVTALLTRMDDPLGLAIGNANETREAILVLHGGGPADLVECTLALGAEMLLLGGVAKTEADARAQLQRAIDTGAGARTFERIIEAQGGDPRVVGDPGLLPFAPELIAIEADHAGVLAGIDAFDLGLAAIAMGGGRTRADETVDHGVGIDLRKKPGQRVERGEVLATLRVRNRATAPVERVRAAFDVRADAAPFDFAPASLVLKKIDFAATDAARSKDTEKKTS